MLKKISSNKYYSNPYEDNSVIVQFIGDTIINDYREIDYHKNPGFEICLIPYGKGIFKIDNISYAVSKGDIFITKEHQLHGGWPSKQDPFRIFYLCVKIKESLNEQNIWMNIKKELDSIEFPIAADNFNITNIHERLIFDIENGIVNEDIVFINNIQNFLLYTLRCFKKQKERLESNFQGIVTTKVMSYLNANLDRDIKLLDIASNLNYSITYICREFKEDTGYSIKQYQTFIRLELAKELLLNKNHTISAIAEKVGYNTIYHFSRAFKGFYGYSPTEFRKMNM